MVLFDNSILKLIYNPASDILEAEYPDLQGYLIPEIKHSINALVDILISYDVKKLLLDSTRTVISVSEDQSREIAMYLAAGVVKTRVQKVARVQSPVSTVENTALGNVNHIRETVALPFLLENFTDKATAIQWLKEDM